MASIFQRARIHRNVDCVTAQHFKGHDLEHGRLGGGQHHRGSAPVRMGSQPVARRDTPSIAWDESEKLELRHRGDQIVSDATLVFKEVFGHHCADGVTAPVCFISTARSVTKPSGHRVGATGFKIASNNVLLHDHQYGRLDSPEHRNVSGRMD